MSGQRAITAPGPWQGPALDHDDLLRRFGSPLFVFFPEVPRRNIGTLTAALARAYPNATVAYSAKTNGLPAVLRCAVASGAALELVAGFETEVAERLALIDRRTVVNGPLKSESDLRRAIHYGCRINVDNVTELEVLERIGAGARTVVKVGLRIAATGGRTPWTRFGFAAVSVPDIARRMRTNMPHVRLVGLHMHGGTNITDVGYYRHASSTLCHLAQSLGADGLIDLEYLDLGGGFATACPFRDADDWRVPTAAEYVEAIVGPIRAAFGAAGPALVLEPGRYLIDDAFVLLTTVERFREPEGREVVVDAGINVLPSARFRRHRVACLGRTAEPDDARPWTIYGPLCMPADGLAEGVSLPALRPGDVLAIDSAGAYSLSQAWTFIQLQPAVVAVEGDDVRLVRRRQTADDVLARDDP